LLQRFEDEFGCVGRKAKIPAEAGSVLVRNEQESLGGGEQTKYGSVVGMTGTWGKVG